MAVGTGGGTPGRRTDGASEPGAVERRVFVNATPREVWATLHDPAADDGALPGAAARSGRAALAGGRDDPLRATPGSGCCATPPGSRASRRGRSRASASG